MERMGGRAWAESEPGRRAQLSIWKFRNLLEGDLVDERQPGSNSSELKTVPLTQI